MHSHAMPCQTGQAMCAASLHTAEVNSSNIIHPGEALPGRVLPLPYTWCGGP